MTNPAFSLTAQEPIQHRQSVRYAHGTEAQDRVVSLLEATEELGSFFQRKPIPTIRDGSIVYVMPKGCDFVGWLQGGRAAIIEVKYTAEPSLELDLLSEFQIEELQRAHSTGVCCVVVVLRGRTPQSSPIHPVPWQVVNDHITTGSKRLPREILDQLEHSRCFSSDCKSFPTEVRS